MNFDQILFVSFIIVAGLEVINLLVLRLATKEKRTYLVQKEVYGVSMIVCFKNEADNITNNIDMWIRQIGVKDWELILVNDGSTDNSLEIIQEKIQGREDFVKVIEINQFDKKGVGKKYALLKGVEAAQYDNIVLTDADCLPASNQWLNIMSKKLGRNEIVLGISPYKYHGGFLNGMICFEALQTILQYVGLANLGRAYMGVGRNLAFKKESFMEYNCFEEHYDIPSGDDDLFVNNAARSGKKLIVCHDERAYTYTEPVKGLGAYWRQKSRHLRAGGKYNIVDLLLLSYLFLNQVFYWSLFIGLMILNISLFKVLLVFVIKETLQFSIFNSMSKFNWKKLNWNLSSVYRVLSLLMQILVLIKNAVSPSKQWK